jgi:hypothetical protein
MEYYLGMEKGPSDAEKEQGEGAKSRVVQEKMVCSVPTSPILDSHAGHAHFPDLDDTTVSNAGVEDVGKGLDDIHAEHETTEVAKLESGKKGKKGTIEDITEGSGHKANDKEDKESNNKESNNKESNNKESNNKEKKFLKEDEPVRVDDIGTGRGPLHVGGRETKVPYRIDHVLQETRVDQYTNEYLLGMRSHFRYWGNRLVLHVGSEPYVLTPLCQ